MKRFNLSTYISQNTDSLNMRISLMKSAMHAAASLRSLLVMLTFVSMGIFTQVQASHIVGGEITYRCLGGNRYEITLSIYRDCDNPGVVNFDNPAIINVFDNRGNLVTNVGVGGAIFMPSPGVTDIISSGINESCDPDFVPVCVERMIYKSTVILPRNPGGYILAHQRCCRNSSLTNLIEPEEQGSTYTTFISEEALASCNSGAVFRNWPDVYVCFGQDINFDHSATDANGDSLVYRLVTPREGASREFPKPAVASRPPYDPVVWAAGFGVDNMLGDSPNPLRIDANTGLLTGRPNLLGQFVVGVVVEEYRNGQLISSHIRDFQYNVIACGDIPIASFDAPSVQCGDLTVNFTNTSQNAEYYEWILTGNGLDTTVVNVENLVFTFPDTGTYEVRLLAFEEENSACVDTATRIINLRNTGLEFDYEIRKLACGELLNLILIDNSTDSVSQIVLQEWTITYPDTTINVTGDSVYVQIPAGVSGTITLTITAANECTITETVDFVAESDEGLFADFDLEIIKCEDEYRVRPIDTSRDDEGDIISWQWVLTDAQGNVDTLTGQVPGEFILIGFQIVSLELTVESTSGCVDVLVREFDLTPTVNFDPAFGLYASECEDRLVIDFRDESYDGPEGSPVSWDWTISYMEDGNLINLTFQEQNFTIEFDTTVALTVTLCITYELDGEVVCENTCTTKELFAHLLGPDHFDREVTICVEGSVELNPNPLVPNVTYSWSPADGLSCTECPNPIASPTETTVYTVEITSTDINCSVIKEVTVNVIDGNDPMDFIFDNECGSLTVTFTAIDGDTSTVSGWDFGDGNTGPGQPIITHTYAQEGTYTVTMMTMGECPMEISKEITIRFIDLSGLQDTIVNCEGEIVELFPGAPAGFVYSWEPADDLIPDGTVGNPSVRVVETSTFFVTITDPNDPDCIIERSVTVFVPEPITLDVDDVIDLCEPQEIVINADSPSAVSYVWRDGNGNIIGEGPRLEYTPAIDETITVTVVDRFGCELTRSVAIEFWKVVFTLDGNNPMCVGDTVTIEVGSPDEPNVVEYMWSPADQIIGLPNEKRIRVSPAQTTTYTVQIAYADGCILTANYTLVVASFPANICDLEVTRDTIFLGESTEICVQFNEDYDYFWQPEEFIDGDNTGNCIRTTDLAEDVEFTVTITFLGCEQECSTTVTVADLICDEPYIFVPNTFSPNGDGFNDILRVRVFEEFLLDLEFAIYNRWGQEVFRTTDISVGWDGTFKGEQMPVDSYGYYLRVGCVGGDTFKKSGSINLVR